MRKNEHKMKWTKTLRAALSIAAIGLAAGQQATAQNSQAKADTARTSATVRIDLSMDDLARIVQAAAEAMERNSEPLKSAVAAAADSTAKTGAEALREVLNVSVDAAMGLLAEINNVADSVATANKTKVAAAKVAAEAKAAQAGKMITEGARTLADMATSMTQAQTDSLRQALIDTRKAIDTAIEKLESGRQR